MLFLQLKKDFMAIIFTYYIIKVAFFNFLRLINNFLPKEKSLPNSGRLAYLTLFLFFLAARRA